MWSNATAYRLPPAFSSTPPNSNLSPLTSSHFSNCQLKYACLFPARSDSKPSSEFFKRFNGAGAVAALSYLPVIFLLQYIAAISGANPNPHGLGKLLSSAGQDSRRSVSFSCIAKD
jgi:hypothetical protein